MKMFNWGINMKNTNTLTDSKSKSEKLTFKIIDVKNEEQIGGFETKITAVCIQDNMKLEIYLDNKNTDDKEYVRGLLLAEHKILSKSIKPKNVINIGDTF